MHDLYVLALRLDVIAKVTFSALVYPRCTNSSPTEPDSDCGSVGWAFTLFISWNLLSMVCVIMHS
jgi:hypothetical protein